MVVVVPVRPPSPASSTGTGSLSTDSNANPRAQASATQVSSPRALTYLSPRASAAARDLWGDVEESDVAMPRAITIHNFFPGAHTGNLLRMWPFSPSPAPERPRFLEEATSGLGSLPPGLDNAPSGLAAAPAATAPAAAAAPAAAEAWPE